MKWLFIGPSKLSGIGQVTYRYAQLVHGEYIEFSEQPSQETYDIGFAFVLPIDVHLNQIDSIMTRCTRRVYMTVCETETVHPKYQDLVTRYKHLFVPSEFCKRILERQFPQGHWSLLRHWDAPRIVQAPRVTEPYTFYTIGNVLDPRKNVRLLIEAFIRLNMQDTRLVIKATCHTPVKVSIPRVDVINGLLSDEDLEKVHASCHCYVNSSHSEGVGMGAVEAALRGKPVIIASYGGLSEYVQTPFVVRADVLVPIGTNDFLYTKDMLWGNPRLDDLVQHMRTCATERITSWDHSFTSSLMDEVRRTMEYPDQLFLLQTRSNTV
jgi:glycosyltransferase involved in cell wall biosynthesis